MAIVRDEKYLHIHRGKRSNWIVGNEFFFGGYVNGFMQEFDTTENKLTDAESGNEYYWNDVARHFSGVLRGQVEKDPIIARLTDYDTLKILDGANSALKESLMLNREIIFEEVRASSFPDLPSRQRCIWLIPDSPDAVTYWWRAIGNPDAKIFRVEGTGKTHWASQSHLEMKSSSLNVLRQRAFRYWAGLTERTSLEDEILFEGFIKITEELPPSDFSL